MEKESGTSCALLHFHVQLHFHVHMYTVELTWMYNLHIDSQSVTGGHPSVILGLWLSATGCLHPVRFANISVVEHPRWLDCRRSVPL